MSSPRSMSRAGLTPPLGPISASATFSMRSRLACMKLNRLFHSDFWMPLNWYSCTATQQTVSLLSVIMHQLASFHSPLPWSTLFGPKVGHALHCCLTCAGSTWLLVVFAFMQLKATNTFLCRLNSMLGALHRQVVLPHNALLDKKMTQTAII